MYDMYAKGGQATLIHLGLLEWDFVMEERDWTQFCLQQGQVGICSEGEEWGSVVGKILRGDISSRGLLLDQPQRIPVEDSPD